MALVEEAPTGKTFEDVMAEADALNNAAPVLDENGKPISPATDKPAADAGKTEEQIKAEADAAEAAKKAEEKAAANAGKTEEQIKEEEAAAAKKAEEDAEADKNNAVVIPEELKKVFPDAQSYSDIVTVHQNTQKELDEANEANQAIVDLLNKNDELKTIIKAIDSGKDIIEAIRDIKDIEERLKPPEFDDKEAYDKYIREKIEREQTRKIELAEAERRHKIADEAAKHAIAMRENFVRNKKMTPERAKAFVDWIQRHIYGDPKTLKLPEDTYEILYKGFTHEDEIAKVQDEAEKKRKQAEIDARNVALRDAAKAKERRGDGIPNLGGGAPVPGQSEQDKLIQSMRTERVVVETPINK